MKYSFTGETKVLNGIILRRIKAERDFKDIKKGDLGGFIEKESNLSHLGNSWIKDDAVVYGNARVIQNGLIQDTVQVFENARVQGNHILKDNFILSGTSVAF